MKNKLPLFISTGILAIFFALIPKIQNCLNEEPKMKRNLEQQIQYTDSIINNYPYSNLYIIENPKGKNWKKFLSCIKEKKSFLIFYGSKECFPCNYAKEYAINFAKKNKDKLVFVINYDFFEEKGEILRDSLLEHDLNESSLPTFILYKKGEKNRFRYTRGDLLRLKLSSY